MSKAWGGMLLGKQLTLKSGLSTHVKEGDMYLVGQGLSLPSNVSSKRRQGANPRIDTREKAAFGC